MTEMAAKFPWLAAAAVRVLPRNMVSAFFSLSESLSGGLSSKVPAAVQLKVMRIKKAMMEVLVIGMVVTSEMNFGHSTRVPASLRRLLHCKFGFLECSRTDDDGIGQESD
ncbi:hypothetical protein Hdeb2414_s0025g00662931 [Helianthus debilis subsp. tardiflorus]